jgi:hypothetical protein
MRALLPLFPSNAYGLRWRGYSLLAHRDGRTRKEVIYERIDSWLRDLKGTGTGTGFAA